MASSNKPAATGARRKSMKSLIITLKLSPKSLQPFSPLPDKEEKEETSSKGSPTSSSSTVVPAATSSNGETRSEPNANTADTPPASALMPPPPIDGAKKKGTKRSAAVALGPDGFPIPKVRGKPGPKKKARLEDGSIDHSATVPRATTGAHKLGPKANQGAINAGLRALDRSGKPCRKWSKGGFTLKSFTGVVWEIPRWKAPPKFKPEGNSEGSASGDSSKENKDSQVESEKSITAVDIEMASSPAPSATPSATPATAAETTEPVVQPTREVVASA